MPVAPPLTAAAPQADIRPLPWAVLTLLAATVFAAVTSEVLPVGLLPQIAGGLHTGESQAGYLISAYAGVVVVGSIPLTALVARWPRRRVLPSLLVVYAVGNLALAATGSYQVGLAGRILAGLAHAAFFSVVVAAATSLVPAHRAGRAIAVVNVGITVALAVGVPLGTALGTAVGWRWAFAAAAGVLLLLAAAIAAVLPSEPAAQRPSSSADVLRPLRSRAMLGTAVLVTVLTLGHYTAYTYITPTLLHAGVSDLRVSLVLFGYGAAGLVGLAAAASWSHRRPRAALMMAVGLTAACLLSLGLLNGSLAAAVATTVWGAAFGALPTLLQVTAMRAAPGSPDAAAATVNSTFNIGIAGGALVGGLELGHTTLPTLDLTGAALVLVALLMVATMMRRPTMSQSTTTTPSPSVSRG